MRSVAFAFNGPAVITQSLPQTDAEAGVILASITE